MINLCFILKSLFLTGDFRERVVPKAVLYYTGEGTDEEEDYEEEEDEDDEEEDGDSDTNATGGKNQEQCKQQ